MSAVTGRRSPVGRLRLREELFGPGRDEGWAMASQMLPTHARVCATNREPVDSGSPSSMCGRPPNSRSRGAWPGGCWWWLVRGLSSAAGAGLAPWR